jgi:Flp pilus assembly protein TadG
MTSRRNALKSDQNGAAAIELSIVLPILILLIWGMLQVSLLFEANAGVQNALGQAARYATIWPTPTDAQIQSKITSAKFGVANGTWSTPSISTDAPTNTKTITVTYSQPTNFLFFNGPNVTITRSKLVYLASA